MTFSFDIQVLQEPGFDHLLLETPLIADAEGGDFLLGNQTIDGDLVYLEVARHLLGG